MHVLKIFWNIHKIKRHFQSYYTFCSFFTFQLFASVPTNPPTFNNLISKRDITYNYNKKERIFFFRNFSSPIIIHHRLYVCCVDNPSPTRKFPTINEIIDKFTIHEHLPQAFLFRIENTNALFFFFFLCCPPPLPLYNKLYRSRSSAFSRSYFIAMTRQMRAACISKWLENMQPSKLISRNSKYSSGKSIDSRRVESRLQFQNSKKKKRRKWNYINYDTFRERS